MSSCTESRLCKDIFRLQKKLKSLFVGQVRLSELDACCELTISILPREGPYASGLFEFTTTLESYPSVPGVRCITPVYHPNIDEAGDVCVSLLEDWTDDYDLTDLAQALLFLMRNPNRDDPLRSMPEEMQSMDEETFFHYIRKTLRGEVVECIKEYEGDDCPFERNVYDVDTWEPEPVTLEYREAVGGEADSKSDAGREYSVLDCSNGTEESTGDGVGLSSSHATSCTQLATVSPSWPKPAAVRAEEEPVHVISRIVQSPLIRVMGLLTNVMWWGSTTNVVWSHSVCSSADKSPRQANSAHLTQPHSIEARVT